MPAAAWIPAVAGVVGGVLGSKSDNKGLQGLAPSLVQGGLGLTGSFLQKSAMDDSAEAQLAAQREALAYEREKDEERRRQYEARERQLSPFRMGAASVLAKYGIDVPIEDAAPPDMAAQEPLVNLAVLGARRPYGR